MTRFVLLAALLAALALASPAFATERESHAAGDIYVGLEGGLSAWNPIDPNVAGVGKSGFLVGAGVVLRSGWQWRDHVRFDGQVGWDGANVKKVAGRIDVVHATANAYWDFAKPGAWVRPYVGGGLGVAGGWLDNNSAGGRLSGVGLAYVLAGGGRFRLTPEWTLACAYQFLGTAALIDNGSGGTINPTLHGFMVGLHKTF